ncbi:MAG: hypothetical protein ACLPVF_06560 [Acidimicrobiales bacterium]
MTSRPQRALRAFGHFWWDFLVGEAPEFAVATALIVGLAYLLEDTRLAAAIVLPLLTAVFLVAAAYRGRRRALPGARSAGEPGAPGDIDHR